MAYTRNPQWKDHPDDSTRIDAVDLENIEQGLALSEQDRRDGEVHLVE